MAGGFGATASVCPTNQITILNAIVTKLRTDIPDLFGSETTCFISDSPWPGVEVNDETFCTVHPADGNFEFDDPTGGGPHSIIENGVFQVTVWSKLLTDRLEHSVHSMTDATRGILKLKQRVLASLAGQQMYADDEVTPLLASGCLRPMNSMHPPSRQGDADFTSFSIAFSGSFYWDLAS